MPRIKITVSIYDADTYKRVTVAEGEVAVKSLIGMENGAKTIAPLIINQAVGDYIDAIESEAKEAQREAEDGA